MADTKNAAKGKTKGKDKGKPSQAEPEVRGHLTIHGYNVLYDLDIQLNTLTENNFVMSCVI